MIPPTAPQPYSIRQVLSSARMATYDNVVDVKGNKISAQQALDLYAWNAQVSAALLVPLHICEIAIRNAISDVLEIQYGARWPWSPGFEQSLPDPQAGYSPRGDLRSARRAAAKPGEVIPELAFVFWQKMFTGRYDVRLWNAYLAQAFPYLPRGLTVSQSRQMLYSDLEHIRKLRNRIAHHEPIFSRQLMDDFQRIQAVINCRSPVAAAWMMDNQQAAWFLAHRPI